jgi:hypothetical protein
MLALACRIAAVKNMMLLMAKAALGQNGYIMPTATNDTAKTKIPLLTRRTVSESRCRTLFADTYTIRNAAMAQKPAFKTVEKYRGSKTNSSLKPNKVLKTVVKSRRAIGIMAKMFFFKRLPALSAS